MPTYKVACRFPLDELWLEPGALVTMPDGALRDQLLSADAIYRPDIGPRSPRFVGEHVFLPVKLVHSPQWPKSFDAAHYLALGMAPSLVADFSAADAKGYYYATPIDEWDIPDEEWPPDLWALYPRNVMRGALRPIT